jgi:hypothetical protein
MLRKKLYQTDVYSGFEYDKTQVDMQGWNSDASVLPWAIEHLKPTLIIEVGTWKGRSAINMAKKIKELNIPGEVLCIDTWLGSPEHWLDRSQGWYDWLKIEHGRPSFYNTFMHNVMHNKCEDVITPFPLTSEAAYFVLSKWEVKTKMIYIDGGHEYESVLRDLEMYWQLLDDGGVLILDDYKSWPGVTRAIEKFAWNNCLEIFSGDNKAVLNKGSTLNLQDYDWK